MKIQSVINNFQKVHFVYISFYRGIWTKILQDSTAVLKYLSHFFYKNNLIWRLRWTCNRTSRDLNFPSYLSLSTKSWQKPKSWKTNQFLMNSSKKILQKNPTKKSYKKILRKISSQKILLKNSSKKIPPKKSYKKKSKKSPQKIKRN